MDVIIQAVRLEIWSTSILCLLVLLIMLFLGSSKGMVKRVINAKIACLDFSLQKTKMKMGVQVIINDPEKLDQIRQR